MRISPCYSLLEALTGALRDCSLRVRDLPGARMGTRVLMAALVVLAGIDLEHRLLPNVIVGPAAFVGLVLSAAEELSRWV